MMSTGLAVIAGLIPMLPAVIYLLKRRQAPAKVTRQMVMGLSTLNLLIALMVVGVGLVWLFAPDHVLAAGPAQDQPVESPYRFVSAAVAVAAGSLGAAYAVSTTGAAAIGAIAEKPELFGSALIFVGLAEGVAIYGLIIAFIIIG